MGPVAPDEAVFRAHLTGGSFLSALVRPMAVGRRFLAACGVRRACRRRRRIWAAVRMQQLSAHATDGAAVGRRLRRSADP